MQTLQLGWQPATALSTALFTGAATGKWLPDGTARSRLLRRVGPRPVSRAVAYLREAGLVAALYALWQLAGSVSVLSGAGALERGRWILRFERAIGLPSERHVQRLITGHPLITQAANWYYATVHFTALGVLLLWLFVRHRQRYPEVRNVLVLLTASSLLIQAIPVAPPRLLPGLGYVDTAARYGQSVYNLSGITVDQLAAMPSVHVGWALLVAWAVLRVSAARYRWWVLAHPILTVFVVVATANHFWLDGIVAAVLLTAAIALSQLPVRRLARAVTGVDHRDPGRAGPGHGGQRLPDTVEADDAGDQLLGPDRAATDQLEHRRVVVSRHAVAAEKGQLAKGQERQVQPQPVGQQAELHMTASGLEGAQRALHHRLGSDGIHRHRGAAAGQLPDLLDDVVR
jgi:PAP2 superfamily